VVVILRGLKRFLERVHQRACHAQLALVDRDVLEADLTLANLVGVVQRLENQ
jgi:hypothetical protein